METTTTSSPAPVQPPAPAPPPIDLKHMTSNSLLSPYTSPTKFDKYDAHERHGHRPAERGNRWPSQNLRAGDAGLVGSPGSIPSSPTSVHSSSSAIFERDIEIIGSPPAHLHSPNSPHKPLDPHRIARAKGTEHLEQSVPSVLDSAAAILATLDIDPTSPPLVAADGGIGSGGVERTTLDQITVVAPAPSAIFETLTGGGGRTSGFASPLSFRSRSPSPLGTRNPGPRHGDLLLNIPSPVSSIVNPHLLSSTVTSPKSPSRSTSTSPPGRTVSLSSSPPHAPSIATSLSRDTGSSLSKDGVSSFVTPTSAYFSAAPSVNDEVPSPKFPSERPTPPPTTSPLPPSVPSTSTLAANPVSPTPVLSPTANFNTASTSHPPSPHHTATKRISFMAYSDLLSSTPASTQPLANYTKEASVDEPPPHIPSVSGLSFGLGSAAGSVAGGSIHGGGNGSRAPSLRGFSLGSPSSLFNAYGGPGERGGGGAPAGVTHAGKRDSIALLDNVGGEWEREGMGMGMEERFDVAAVGGRSWGGSPVRGVVGLPVSKV